jgi:hypothetical protein
MPQSCTRLALLGLPFAAGCASQAAFLNQHQDQATHTAVARAPFELNCQ